MNEAFGPLSEVVSSTSAPQQIADHFLSAIAVGAMPAGTALPPERELAEALQVSRTSVRAAMERLDRLGFVVRRRGRGGGTFIAEVSPESLRAVQSRLTSFRAEQQDALEARALLQGRAALLAARRRGPAELVRIEALAAEYERADEAVGARAADAAFHREITRAAHNAALLAYHDDLDAQINMGFRHDPFSARLFDRAVHDHADITSAIRDHDAEAAARLVEEHFRATTMDA